MAANYNVVNCSTCLHCCAYSYSNIPYCASKAECNQPGPISSALYISICILCIFVFAAIIIVMYYLFRNREFDVPI